jgi:hypothetical protein
MPLSHYQQRIREDLARLGLVGRHEPAVIEAWMRLEHSTLDHLSSTAFRAEVATASQCADASTSAENAALVASYGLDQRPTVTVVRDWQRGNFSVHQENIDPFPASVECGWCGGEGKLTTGGECAECEGTGKVAVLA